MKGKTLTYVFMYLKCHKLVNITPRCCNQYQFGQVLPSHETFCCITSITYYLLCMIINFFTKLLGVDRNGSYYKTNGLFDVSPLASSECSVAVGDRLNTIILLQCLE